MPCGNGLVEEGEPHALAVRGDVEITRNFLHEEVPKHLTPLPKLLLHLFELGAADHDDPTWFVAMPVVLAGMEDPAVGRGLRDHNFWGRLSLVFPISIILIF